MCFSSVSEHLYAMQLLGDAIWKETSGLRKLGTKDSCENDTNRRCQRGLDLIGDNHHI